MVSPFSPLLLLRQPQCAPTREQATRATLYFFLPDAAVSSSSLAQSPLYLISCWAWIFISSLSDLPFLRTLFRREVLFVLTHLMTPRHAHLQIVTARRQGRLGQPCRSHDILLGVSCVVSACGFLSLTCLGNPPVWLHTAHTMNSKCFSYSAI